MDTALSADVQYFAQQPPEQIHLILSGMTALMQDTEGKMAAMQSQNWFQRMARTVTGRNKLTLEEIRQNHEKLNLYMAGVVTELYQQGRVDRRIMMSLGAQLNEIYADHVQLKQMLGAFVVKLNEKIDSVDNFHMLITEIEQGVYTGNAPLVGICKVLSQFDRRTLDDTRKLDIIRRSLSSQNIIREEPVLLTGHLASVLDIPMSEAGQVYLELGSIRENFIASILMKMMENYHFLPDMARRTKSRKSLIEKVLREEDLDETIALSTQEVYDDFVSSKVEIQSGFLSLPHGSDFPATDVDISETDIPEEDSAEKVSRYRTAAENGDPQAQYDLGVCYQTGDGVEPDIHTAIEWYQKAAAKGHADAQNRLGVRYDNGDGVEEDSEKAVFWFRKAAQQGHAKAQCNLGRCYMNGSGVEQDVVQGFSWFRKSAEQGDATAQYYLGQCYLWGDGVREDEAQAFHWFQKSAEQGDIDAKFRLGDCFYYGFGVEENPKQAVPLYREAAENGHAGAQYALGLCYFFGNGVQEDESEAVKWYRKSAEQGNSAAQFELGRCYHNGTGVQEDEGEAVSWFREAAEQGHEEAQILMGTAFLTGSGVNKDPAQAVEWYRKSAEQGFAIGQLGLGECYYNGRVPKRAKESKA